MIEFAVVVPWVSEAERDLFMEQWGVSSLPHWLMMQRDEQREGCGATKNRGISRAVDAGAEVVVVLDSDCFPADGVKDLAAHAQLHVAALQPQRVELFEEVTSPPSRGTPYRERTAWMPVAASMGFWTQIGDYCAVRQLATGAAPMTHRQKTVYARYFPLCGMNLAFRPKDWLPWCRFIPVSRFDDIWMGWLWQREAYRRGHCFNLAGPLVRHARQSNVWANLRDEAVHLEANETLWLDIALCPSDEYEVLRRLLPV